MSSINWYKEASIIDDLKSFFKGLGISTLMVAITVIGYAGLRQIMETYKNNPEAARSHVLTRIKSPNPIIVEQITPTPVPKIVKQKNPIKHKTHPVKRRNRR